MLTLPGLFVIGLPKLYLFKTQPFQYSTFPKLNDVEHPIGIAPFIIEP